MKIPWRRLVLAPQSDGWRDRLFGRSALEALLRQPNFGFAPARIGTVRMHDDIMQTMVAPSRRLDETDEAFRERMKATWKPVQPDRWPSVDDAPENEKKGE